MGIAAVVELECLWRGSVSPTQHQTKIAYVTEYYIPYWEHRYRRNDAVFFRQGKCLAHLLFTTRILCVSAAGLIVMIRMHSVNDCKLARLQ